MFKPREGTEAYYVEQEVERRQKIAAKKQLDVLFSKTYHDCLGGYASWIKDPENKTYVWPGVKGASEGKTKEGEHYLEIETSTGTYRITSESSYAYMGDTKYNDLSLFLDGKKVFAITETVTDDEFGSYYSPLSIKAYVNEDWVVDFKAMQEHRKRVDEEAAIKYAEDPKKTERLKKEFGITEVNKDHGQDDGSVKPFAQAAPVKRPMKSGTKIALWIILVIIILAVLF